MTFSLREVRKILLCSLLLQMLIINETIPANAFPTTVVKVEPQSNMASISENFTVDITITDIQNLFGLEVTLYWDAPILRIVQTDNRLGVESRPDGVLHEPFFNQTIQEEGRYQLVATSTGSDTPSFNGSGNIVRITFEVLKAGSTELNLEAKLANKPSPGGVASPITHTTRDGSFSTPAQGQPIWPNTAILVIIVIAIIVAMVIYRRAKKH